MKLLHGDVMDGIANDRPVGQFTILTEDQQPTRFVGIPFRNEDDYAIAFVRGGKIDCLGWSDGYHRIVDVARRLHPFQKGSR